MANTSEQAFQDGLRSQNLLFDTAFNVVDTFGQRARNAALLPTDLNTSRLNSQYNLRVAQSNLDNFDLAENLARSRTDFQIADYNNQLEEITSKNRLAQFENTLGDTSFMSQTEYFKKAYDNLPKFGDPGNMIRKELNSQIYSTWEGQKEYLSNVQAADINIERLGDLISEYEDDGDQVYIRGLRNQLLKQQINKEAALANLDKEFLSFIIAKQFPMSVSIPLEVKQSMGLIDTGFIDDSLGVPLTGEEETDNTINNEQVTDTDVVTEVPARTLPSELPVTTSDLPQTSIFNRDAENSAIRFNDFTSSLPEATTEQSNFKLSQIDDMIAKMSSKENLNSDEQQIYDYAVKESNRIRQKQVDEFDSKVQPELPEDVVINLQTISEQLRNFDLKPYDADTETLEDYYGNSPITESDLTSVVDFDTYGKKLYIAEIIKQALESGKLGVEGSDTYEVYLETLLALDSSLEEYNRLNPNIPNLVFKSIDQVKNLNKISPQEVEPIKGLNVAP